MAQANFAGKERVGKVTIERFRDSIRLRWTLNGKTYSLTAGKDSRDTLKAARAKAQLIDADITFERFDSSLTKYGKQQSMVSEVVSPIQETTLSELWEQYVENKLPSLKPLTIEKYKQLTKLFNKLGNKLSFDSLATKKAFLEVTTVDRTRDCLMYLSACCEWAIKRKLTNYNPFNGMSAEMPKPKYLLNPNPNSFTESEREKIIEAFKTDIRSGMNYSYYASLVEFWFLTGCRPSEAIGLTWDKITDDCSGVTFDGSIQTLSSGVKIRSKGSKNNNSRTLAVSSRVQKLLQSIKPISVGIEQLVFHSPESINMPINYRNFARRGWTAIVDPIKPGTTPYNCRDTFITLQLLKGTPSAIIAKWCDTSTSQIDISYADKLKLNQLRPID